MIVEGWVTVSRVGCRVKFDVEIPAEELEGKTEGEREGIISEYVRQEMWNGNVDWGWKAAE